MWATPCFRVRQIVAEHIRFIPWPGKRLCVSAVRAEGRVWFVAADLCRALEYALSSNGKPNDPSSSGVAAEHRHFAALETQRGTFKPYSRLALTSASGLIALAARQRAKSTGAVMPETRLRVWIARAAADLVGLHDSEEGTTAGNTFAERATARTARW
jgi:hypothetical protein